MKSEPVDIHPQFIKVVECLLEANTLQKRFSTEALAPGQLQKKLTQVNQQTVKVPELLVQRKRFN